MISPKMGIIPVVWLGLLIAPSVKGGLPEILTSLMNAMNDPFHIELCEDSVKAVLVLLLCYGMGVGIYFSTRRNYRRREEHGSAKWGDANAVNKKYAQQTVAMMRSCESAQDMTDFLDEEDCFEEIEEDYVRRK